MDATRQLSRYHLHVLAVMHIANGKYTYESCHDNMRNLTTVVTA